MIRLRPLRPREQRNLRHWAMELAVVVIGVLLALWAAEWASDREQTKRDALAIDAVRKEMMQSVVTVSMWQAHDACFRDQIAHVRDLLSIEGEDWPGITRHATSMQQSSNAVIPSIFSIWSGRPSFTAWNAAKLSGAIDRLDAPQREKMSDLYQLMEAIGESMDETNVARDRIGGLALPQRLERADRLEAFSQLKIMDGNRIYIGRDWPQLAFGASQGEREWMNAENAKLEAMLLESSKPMRPCFGPVRLPTAFGVEDAE